MRYTIHFNDVRLGAVCNFMCRNTLETAGQRNETSWKGTSQQKQACFKTN